MWSLPKGSSKRQSTRIICPVAPFVPTTSPPLITSSASKDSHWPAPSWNISVHFSLTSHYSSLPKGENVQPEKVYSFPFFFCSRKKAQPVEAPRALRLNPPPHYNPLRFPKVSVLFLLWISIFQFVFSLNFPLIFSPALFSRSARLKNEISVRRIEFPLEDLNYHLKD